MAHAKDDWFTCPVCGEVVKANALACPHCGSDDETGWSEAAEYDEVDLPDEAFGDGPRTRRINGPAMFLATLALIVALLLIVTGVLR